MSTFIQTATNYGSGVLLLLGVLYLYDKYKQKENEMEYYENQAVIQEYLLNHEFNGDKPFLWIPLTYEVNTRQWRSFMSRKTTDLNQPYLDATIASIIRHNSKDFNVCILDDRSYSKLLPSWKISLVDTPEPIRSHLRNLALMKVLYEYGGLITPPSFLCIESLFPIYQQRSPMVCVEGINRTSSSEHTLFTPSFSFMGATPQCPLLEKGVQRFEAMVSKNYTHELEFWGQWNRWCYEQVHNGRMKVIDGTLVGVKRDTRTIPIDDLLSERNGYELFKHIKYGIWIPHKEILERTNYQWFARMSYKQIVDSHLAIANYFVLSN